MKRVNLKKITALIKTGLLEQKIMFVVEPLVAGLAIGLVAVVLNADWTDRVGETIRLLGILGWFFPVMNTFNGYLKGVNKNATLILPMSVLEKYAGILVSCIAHAVVWLLFSSISGIAVLLFVGHLSSVAPLQVVQDVVAGVRVWHILACIFLASLLMLFMIAGHVQKRYRRRLIAVPVTLFLLLFVPSAFHILFPELLSVENSRIFMKIYMSIMILIAVYFGYRNFNYMEATGHE